MFLKKTLRILNVRGTLKDMRNFLLRTCILFKNVHLLLILNTQSFRRKMSIRLEMNFKNLKYFCETLSESGIYFWYINALKIVNVFFFLILCTPKTLKKVQFKFQKCLAEVFVKDIYYKLRQKSINFIASLTKSLKRAR